MSKVFVVVDAVDYEGYGVPHGVWSTREAAQAYVDEQKNVKDDYWKDYREWEVLEYTIDG